MTQWQKKKKKTCSFVSESQVKIDDDIKKVFTGNFPQFIKLMLSHMAASNSSSHKAHKYSIKQTFCLAQLN